MNDYIIIKNINILPLVAPSEDLTEPPSLTRLRAFQKSQANCLTLVTFVVKREQLEDSGSPLQ